MKKVAAVLLSMVVAVFLVFPVFADEAKKKTVIVMTISTRPAIL